MALSYKARRRWSLVILLIGMPIYIILATVLISLFNRPPIWAEFLIYVVLGIAWILPFKSIFLGIGQADPDAEPTDNPSSGPTDGPNNTP